MFSSRLLHIDPTLLVDQKKNFKFTKSVRTQGAVLVDLPRTILDRFEDRVSIESELSACLMMIVTMVKSQFFKRVHTHTHTHTHAQTRGDAHNVSVFVVGNGHDDTCSNPG